MRRKETGALGEKVAADFLKGRGYRIVETNYRCRGGEADIIAWDGDCLVFAEVRAKTSSKFGSPEESITRTKKARLRAVAANYLQTLEKTPLDWRIDLVAIEFDGAGRPARIELIQNAVEE